MWYLQAEVDRFQDTVQLLKDYYKGMEGHIPDEAKTEHARLALIELPLTDKSGVQSRPFTPEAEVEKPTPPPDEERSTPKPKSPKGSRSRSRSGTPKGKKRGKSAKKEEEAPSSSPPPATLTGRR